MLTILKKILIALKTKLSLLASKLPFLFAPIKAVNIIIGVFKNRKLLNFIISSLIILTAITALLVEYYKFSKIQAKDNLDNSKTVLVNIVTGEIFAGKLYKAPEKLEQKKSPDEAKSSSAAPFAQITEPKTPKDYRIQTDSKEPENIAKIAIVVTDLGLNKNFTLEVLKAEIPLTLGFTPYSQDIKAWIEQAHANKFESLLHLPMQPVDYPVNDPGPFAMLHNLSFGENLLRLNSIENKTDKIVGLYAKNNESFTSSRSNVLPIFEELGRKNYLFFSQNISNAKNISGMCESEKLECLFATVNIDENPEPDKIQKNLLILEGMANSNGRAIGVIGPYPVSLKMVLKWAQEISPKQIVIVPISQLLSKKESADKKPSGVELNLATEKDLSSPAKAKSLEATKKDE